MKFNNEDIAYNVYNIANKITLGEVAIGGYPALVKQGILKKERDTKDVDICVFSNDVQNWRSVFANLMYERMRIIRRMEIDKQADFNIEVSNKGGSIIEGGDDVSYDFYKEESKISSIVN